MNQAGYRTLRFDIFGRGFSEQPNDCRFDVDMYVGHVQSLLQRLQLADIPVILVGHSMGGQVVRPANAPLCAPSPDAGPCDLWGRSRSRSAEHDKPVCCAPLARPGLRRWHTVSSTQTS